MIFMIVKKQESIDVMYNVQNVKYFVRKIIIIKVYIKMLYIEIKIMLYTLDQMIMLKYKQRKMDNYIHFIKEMMQKMKDVCQVV